MRIWCERPGMFLVGAPDFRTINLSMLRSYIDGYETALRDFGLPSQHKPFLDWLNYHRPEFKQGTFWYREARLQKKLVTSHQEAIAQILTWLDEYESAAPTAR